MLTLALLALALRLVGLAASDGRMGTDEARLAISAEGVLATGLPVMPSGHLYPRGITNSYLEAGSFALLGRSDFAARLPSALAGALLVPMVFLLGRALGGAPVGLTAAIFVTLADPLVSVSRQAWPPSLLLLLFTLTAFCWYRGFVEARGRWQVAGAATFILSVLTYEFGVLLAGGLGFYLGVCLLRGDRSWYRGRLTLVALGLVLGGVLLFVALALALRAATLAGPLAEVRTYLAPSGRLSGLKFYLDNLLAVDWPLAATALLGLPLVVRTRARGVLFLGGLFGLALLVPSFVIQSKYAVRYAVPVLPLLAVLGAAGAVELGRALGRALFPTRRLASVLPPLLLLGVLALTLFDDALDAGRRFVPPPRSTWLQVIRAQGLRPTDLLVTDVPTIVQFYLGRNEFYLPAQESEERYAYQAPDAIRSLYTDAILLHEPGDFERLLEQPYAGRTVWFLGRGERLEDLARAVDPALWPSLVASADRSIPTRDGWVLLRLTLPRRAPAG